jgi:hypothetical protein
MDFKYFLIICTLFLSGCWSMDYKYSYKIELYNQTNDSLRVLISTIYVSIDEMLKYDTSNLDRAYSHHFIIEPLSSKAINNIGVNNDVELKEGVFDIIDSVFMFRRDSLKTIWYFPVREEPDSIHNFFNWNSWEIKLTDEKYGYCRFTIYPEDLNKE